MPFIKTLWFSTALLADGWADRIRILHADGVILDIERDTPPAPADERHEIALPGLCNLHSHAFQRAMAGMTEVQGSSGDNFWTWREVMYRFVDRMGPDDLESIAAFAFAEMLQAGFTRVGEFHYVHHDPDGRVYDDPAELCGRIAAASETAGIGLTLLPVFYAHSGFGGAEPAPGQRRFINTLDGFGRIHARAQAILKGLSAARLGVAPHSLRAVTPEQLPEISNLAPEGPIHIHVAEQLREVEDCMAWSGQRPVEWLLRHAGIDRRWCLVHATHMTPDEIVGLAASGAVAGLCPITEANLGDGVFPADQYQATGGAFGVGTDSNVQIDAAAELRLLEYSQRLLLRSRNVLAGGPGVSTGATLFAGALAGGAQALASPGQGLAIGAPLDLITLDARHSAFIGRAGDALLDGWIFAGGMGAIDCVWRDGRKVVERGRHLRMETIARSYRRTLERLLSR